MIQPISLSSYPSGRKSRSVSHRCGSVSARNSARLDSPSRSGSPEASFTDRSKPIWSSQESHMPSLSVSGGSPGSSSRSGSVAGSLSCDSVHHPNPSSSTSFIRTWNQTSASSSSLPVDPSSSPLTCWKPLASPRKSSPYHPPDLREKIKYIVRVTSVASHTLSPSGVS